MTGDPVAVLLRGFLEASGIVTWMQDRFHDTRRQADFVHDLPSLLRTTVLLAAQGWRDHDDADALRHDPVMRLARSSAAGLTPLVVEKGLASQPTLSRFTAIMADPRNPAVLRESPFPFNVDDKHGSIALPDDEIRFGPKLTCTAFE